MGKIIDRVRQRESKRQLREWAASLSLSPFPEPEQVLLRISVWLIVVPIAIFSLIWWLL